MMVIVIITIIIIIIFCFTLTPDDFVYVTHIMGFFVGDLIFLVLPGHLKSPPNNRPNETETNVTAQGNIHMKTTRYRLAVT